MDIGDEIHTRPPYKTRSASISAPGHSSMETIINPPSGGGGTPEGGTPGYRRRRQATRSQSARITAPRNVSIIPCRYPRRLTSNPIRLT